MGRERGPTADQQRKTNGTNLECFSQRRKFSAPHCREKGNSSLRRKKPLQACQSLTSFMRLPSGNLGPWMWPDPGDKITRKNTPMVQSCTHSYWRFDTSSLGPNFFTGLIRPTVQWELPATACNKRGFTLAPEQSSEASDVVWM